MVFYGLLCCAPSRGMALILVAGIPICAAIWIFFFKFLGLPHFYSPVFAENVVVSSGLDDASATCYRAPKMSGSPDCCTEAQIRGIMAQLPQAF